MTEQFEPSAVPDWDLADRMRKALRNSDLGVQEIADYLGVSRNTVGTWINGKITPKTQTLRLWALKTGVPFEWLQTGEPAPSPSTPVTRRYELRPVTFGDFGPARGVSLRGRELTRAA